MHTCWMARSPPSATPSDRYVRLLCHSLGAAASRSLVDRLATHFVAARPSTGSHEQQDGIASNNSEASDGRCCQLHATAICLRSSAGGERASGQRKGSACVVHRSQPLVKTERQKVTQRASPRTASDVAALAHSTRRWGERRPKPVTRRASPSHQRAVCVCSRLRVSATV